MDNLNLHDQGVAVLLGDLPYVAYARLDSLALFDQLGIGVRGAAVGVVAALLPLEVQLVVAPGRRAAVVVYALESLVRGPGLNQHAVHAEEFVAGELAPLGAKFDALEQGADVVFVEQAFAVKSRLPLIVLFGVARRWLHIVLADAGECGEFFNGLLKLLAVV